MLLCDFFSARHSALGYFFRIIIELKHTKQKVFPYVERARVFPALGMEASQKFWPFSFSAQKTPSQFVKNSYCFVFGRPLCHPLKLPNPRAMGQTSNSVDFLSARLCVKLLLTVLFLVWDTCLSREHVTLPSHACLAFLMWFKVLAFTFKAWNRMNGVWYNSGASVHFPSCLQPVGLRRNSLTWGLCFYDSVLPVSECIIL